MKAKKSKPVTGLERIAAERARQITRLGWTAEHDDDEHHDGSLALAAVCYAACAAGTRVYKREQWGDVSYVFEDPWPWSEDTDRRPQDKKLSKKAKLRLLEKAGALIAAEIDRVARQP